MLKRDDGYVLSYVLVILLVLCIIATAVMAPPLRNLQRQQASIERMQDKYAAQGMVEQVMARLDNVSELPVVENMTIQGCTVTTSDSAKYVITAKSGTAEIHAVILLTQTADRYYATYDSYELTYN